MGQARDSGNRIISRAMNQGTCQKVAYTTHAESATWQATTKAVLITATSNAWILFGVNPVATVANSTYLPLGVPFLFAAVQGQKVSVIQDSAAGNLSITEQA